MRDCTSFNNCLIWYTISLTSTFSFFFLHFILSTVYFLSISFSNLPLTYSKYFLIFLICAQFMQFIILCTNFSSKLSHILYTNSILSLFVSRIFGSMCLTSFFPKYRGRPLHNLLSFQIPASILAILHISFLVQHLVDSSLPLVFSISWKRPSEIFSYLLENKLCVCHFNFFT